MPAKKTTPQKSCCPSCPLCCCPEKYLPWLLAILFTILITVSAIYAYQAYLSRKPRVWVEPPFLPPTETPTSSTGPSIWQTYKNDQYGFEFKYPSGWSLVDSFDASYENKIVEINSNFLVATYADGAGGGIPLNYILWIRKANDMYRGGSAKDVQLKKESINGQDAYTNFNAPGMYGECATYFKSNKGYYLEFNFSPYNVNNSTEYKSQDKFFQEFRQILSTFKFLDSTSSTSTSTWRTYKNDQYGFEIKYPDSWRIISDPMPRYTSGINFVDNDNCIWEYCVISNISETTLNKNQFLDKYWNNVIATNNTKTKPKEFKIRGFEATQITETDTTNLNTEYTFIQTPKGNFIFSTDTGNDLNNQTAYQVLSTFKFFDATTTKTTKEITENWNTIKFSWYGLTCKIPEGWGIINDALNGRFIPVYSDKTFTEGFSPIQIQKNQTSKNNLTLALNEGAKGSKNFYEISGSEPEFDYIISTCEFSQVNH